MKFYVFKIIIIVSTKFPIWRHSIVKWKKEKRKQWMQNDKQKRSVATVDCSISWSTQWGPTMMWLRFALEDVLFAFSQVTISRQSHATGSRLLFLMQWKNCFHSTHGCRSFLLHNSFSCQHSNKVCATMWRRRALYSQLISGKCN